MRKLKARGNANLGDTVGDLLLVVDSLCSNGTHTDISVHRVRCPAHAREETVLAAFACSAAVKAVAQSFFFAAVPGIGCRSRPCGRYTPDPTRGLCKRPWYRLTRGFPCSSLYLCYEVVAAMPASSRCIKVKVSFANYSSPAAASIEVAAISQPLPETAFAGIIVSVPG